LSLFFNSYFFNILRVIESLSRTNEMQAADILTRWFRGTGRRGRRGVDTWRGDPRHAPPSS